MNLRNRLEHTRNTLVKVNGNYYRIGFDQLARDVLDEDAKKLLKGTTWEVVEGELPPEEKPFGAKEIQAPIQVEKPKKAPEQPPQPQVKPEVPKAAQAAPVEAEEAADADPESEGEEAAEWPDPDESMPKKYLQEMADAYAVEYDNKTTKKELVALINTEMYPGDKE